jgi:hypothetical protein
MAKRSGLSFRIRGCQRCGGDAYLESAEEDADWRCLQCGRVVVIQAQAETEEQQQAVTVIRAA